MPHTCMMFYSSIFVTAQEYGNTSLVYSEQVKKNQTTGPESEFCPLA